ncbi:MAG: hypothetical protein LBC07_06960 [Elusimicrobiota bacterium]|jgi:hypothetical protein|nr:hypothetical protein [Elusimicrobiota bacterium]
MRKVKNFKIHLTPKEITRLIKRLDAKTQYPENFEFTVNKAIKHYIDFIYPSVIYDVFSKGFLTLSKEPDEKETPAKWIARSFFFLTIGDAIEQEFLKDKQRFGEYSAQIVSSIAAGALNQAKNFVCRLIAAQAEDEDCQCLHDAEVDPSLYGELAQVLPIEKIGLSLVDGKFEPKYSMCCASYWIGAKKKK